MDGEKRELLTIPKAAAELGITRATLWKYVDRGKLTAQQLSEGGVWVIDREDLEIFKASRPERTNKPGPKPRPPKSSKEGEPRPA